MSNASVSSRGNAYCIDALGKSHPPEICMVSIASRNASLPGIVGGTARYPMRSPGDSSVLP